ncbi:hypothetical protein [Rhizobium sp. Leaf383]|uniref:hypothetical protein n=1 Tax=Rhizobium sp. Leaf383 TaxID=1736357 RepID=UPI0007153051|nr:hypothetical protein [Rhizobium sp. Leaf383]KQS74513.1 hypothetical protein ASG58_16240 [Rhizobium sp. Leaf383]
MRVPKTDRQKKLLAALATYELRKAPKGVGLKTAIVARDLGLVEIEMDGRIPSYRLTKAGRTERFKEWSYSDDPATD